MDHSILDEVMRDNNIKVRECKNVSVAEQSNDKVDIIENMLIKSKLLVQDLRIYTERVCLEHDKL